ncbi:hypothetical protein IFM89_019957 [Coptis chinensis]|uniref:Uncharacterized protein n=1 Tax=Coptis chinensis TaxID=261450 RepID=A0A835HFR3_9MAGN|nr:hypothetical protein IFM89_019957 [Coptis chinensis]
MQLGYGSRYKLHTSSSCSFQPQFQVKVSSPRSMDVIPKSFPPSTASFNSRWKVERRRSAVLVPEMSSIIKLGDIVPADARLLEGDLLKIDQSIFFTVKLLVGISFRNFDMLGGMHAWFAAFVDTWYAVVVPIIGVQGFRWAIDNDRQGSFSIKEFDEQCLKLRVACGNQWHYSLSRRDLPDILLSAARSLFEQIIYAHKKSFGEEKYAEIRATFDCIHGHKNKSRLSNSCHHYLCCPCFVVLISNFGFSCFPWCFAKEAKALRRQSLASDKLHEHKPNGRSNNWKSGGHVKLPPSENRENADGTSHISPPAYPMNTLLKHAKVGASHCFESTFALSIKISIRMEDLKEGAGRRFIEFPS